MKDKGMGWIIVDALGYSDDHEFDLAAFSRSGMGGDVAGL